jgi:hypothetical protein
MLLFIVSYLSRRGGGEIGRTIMSSVPAPSDTIPNGPTRDIISNGSYTADNLMTRDDGTVNRPVISSIQ